MKILKILFFLLLCLFLAWTAVLRTPWVKEQARSLLQKELADRGINLSVEEFTLLPSLQISASRAVLSDSKSRIEIEKLHVDPSLWYFLQGKIVIESLQLEEVKAELDPSLFAASGEMPLLTDLPTGFLIEEWQIRGLHVLVDNQAITDAPLELKGRLMAEPKKKTLSFAVSGNLQEKEEEKIAIRATLLQKSDHYFGPFDLRHPQISLLGKARLSFDGSIALTELEADAGPVQAKGALALTPDLAIQDSEIRLTFPDFSEWGEITGKARLSGSVANPGIYLELRSPRLTFMERELNDALVTVTASYLNQKVSGQAAVSVTKNRERIEYQSDFLWRENPEKRSAQMNFSGELDALLDLFELDTPFIGGKFNAGIRLLPTPEKQKWEAYIDITDGLYEIVEIGTVVQDVEARLDITTHTIVIEKLSGNDGKEGKLTAAGAVQIDPKNQFPFEINFQIDQFAVVQMDYSQALGSGLFTLSGNAEGGKLSGKIALLKPRITIPEQIPELAETIEVTYINIPAGETAPTASSSSASSWPLDFDLTLSLQDKLKIRDEGLRSDWKGEVKLGGRPGELRLDGELSLTDGQYRFQGKSFKITEGTITFQGDPKKKTSLYVIGLIEIDDKDIEVIVKGNLNHPAINFRSNPPMGQKEILSWLIFGRGASTLTDFQGSQLNDSITDLRTGKSTGPDPLTKFRDAMGIDRIDIGKSESSSSEDVTLSVGKYISKGTYLSLSKRNVTRDNKHFIQGTSVAVETELRRHLKLQAEVGDDGNGQLNLLWKRDY